MDNKLSKIYGQCRGFSYFWAHHLFKNVKKYLVEFLQFCPIKQAEYFEGSSYPKPHLFIPYRNLNLTPESCLILNTTTTQLDSKIFQPPNEACIREWGNLLDKIFHSVIHSYVTVHLTKDLGLVGHNCYSAVLLGSNWSTGSTTLGGHS